MNKKTSKYINIIGLVLSIILIIGVRTFAHPCEGMVETAKGSFIPMKCNWLAIAAQYLALGLATVSIANLVKKSKSTIEYICMGILIVAIRFDNIGIGKCMSDTMPCNVTAKLILVIGIVIAILGLIQFFIKNEVEL